MVATLFYPTSLSPSDLQVELSELVMEILQLLPRLNQVSLVSVKIARLATYLEREGPKWKKLYLTSVIAPFEFEKESPFTNLEELRCCFGMTNTVKRVYLPPLLQKLEIFRIDAPLLIIVNASTSILRSLDLNLSSLFILQNVPQVPHLEHLRLNFVLAEEDGALAEVSQVANTVQSCRFLVSLSLNLDYSEYRPLVEPFLRHPPPSLRHLNFLGLPPLFDALVPIIESGSLDSIQSIRFEESRVQSRIEFGEICQRKRIQIQIDEAEN